MAAAFSRETVAAALFSLVDTAVGNVVGLQTSSRVLRAPQNVTPEQCPALFQSQRGEEYEHTFGKMIKLPPKRTMLFEMWLYVSDAQEPNIVPSTQLNNMVGAIENALMPFAALDGPQTLGGLTVSARIDGKIEYAEAFTTDGKSVAVVPIAVLVP